MNLIVETDLGHDPDDFFAICYLIAAGVNIRHISVTPGDPDQIAIADFIGRYTNQNFSISATHENRTKNSSGSIHHEILKLYKQPLGVSPDSVGPYMLLEEYDICSDVEFLIIGPPTNTGRLFKSRPDINNQVTIQGGFLGYSQHTHECVRLEKFEGKSWMPTFNLNGDRKGAEAIIGSNAKLRFVSKNVCHTVVFDRERFSGFNSPPRNPAEELFLTAATLYLSKHSEKKFHDPTAAVCMLHPEIATWVKGRMKKVEGGWGGHYDLYSQHDMIANIDYESLWRHLREFD